MQFASLACAKVTGILCLLDVRATASISFHSNHYVSNPFIAQPASLFIYEMQNSPQGYSYNILEAK